MLVAGEPGGLLQSTEQALEAPNTQIGPEWLTIHCAHSHALDDECALLLLFYYCCCRCFDTRRQGAIVPGNVNSCSKAAMVYLEIIIGNTTMTNQTLQTYHKIDRADMETELCKKSHGKSTQA